MMTAVSPARLSPARISPARISIVAALAWLASCCPPQPQTAASPDRDAFGAPQAFDAALWRRVIERNDGYRTRQELHRVTIHYRDSRGTWRKRSIRGVLAISRPFRFRLAALSPLGLRLFDLYGDQRGVRVIQRRSRATGAGLKQLARSIGGDISAIYRLAAHSPPTTRRPSRRGKATFLVTWPRAPSSVVVDARSWAIVSARLHSDRDRRIRYLERRRQAGVWIAHRILVDNQPAGQDGPGYRLEIKVSAVELDRVLHPRLFEVR